MSSRGSTIVYNLGPSIGGVLAYEGEIRFDRSILGDNLGQQCGEVNGGVVSGSGHNIVSDTSCGFSEPGDLEATDPLLAPLDHNGGRTESYMPQSDSAVIDAYDIGAVEYGPQVASPVFTNGFEMGATWAWAEP